MEAALEPGTLRHRYILGMRVDATTYEEASERVVTWARIGHSGYVCVGTVHMVMESKDHPSFRKIINEADLVSSDGMPLVWGLRLLGIKGATRVYGPDLTLKICARAADEGIPVGFYGGTREALAALVETLQARHGALEVPYAFSPPFRPLDESEELEHAEAIQSSGCRILFVGLGCPKQERWMARQLGRIPAVMVGVGAAFDLIPGLKRTAPRWMQKAGLEWLFRMATEPRRLWRRYMYNNPRFLALFARQLLISRSDDGRKVG